MLPLEKGFSFHYSINTIVLEFFSQNLLMCGVCVFASSNQKRPNRQNCTVSPGNDYFFSSLILFPQKFSVLEFTFLKELVKCGGFE